MKEDLLNIAIITASVIITSYLIISLKTSDTPLGKLLSQPIQIKIMLSKTKVLFKRKSQEWKGKF